MDANNKIDEVRKKIDQIDEKIIKLILNRISFSKEIGKIKNNSSINIFDKNRENYIVKRLFAKINGQLKKSDIEIIFSSIFNVSKKIQKK